MTQANCSHKPPNHVCSYTTPSGFFLQTYDLDMAKYTSINTSTDYGPDTKNPTLIGFASLVSNGIFYDKPPNITECMLSWCAKTYENATSRNGVFSATVKDHDLEYSYTWEDPDSLTLVSWDVFGVKRNDLPGGPNTTFMIHRSSLQSMGAFIDTVLQAGVSNGYYQFQSGTLEAGVFNFGNLMLNDPTISDMGESLAKGLTNIVRNMSTTYTEQFPGVSHVFAGLE
ncbi:hypothetical protein M436DRAFT_66915 [Aureobasidium namibiae CBS 147.97]|uniref:Uncharacterized protein n=1 Tax=Aureobasidium namibiae CBS 147.97 TaxID=1043004 RepID=A0A074W9A4_9PEZI